MAEAFDADILLVDDDPDLLASMAELLLDLGYKVKAFPDADSALNFALTRRFKVGLVDYRLGGLRTGLDVVETIQGLGNKAIFVLITADVERATQMRAIHLKLFKYLNKPVEPATLIETIEGAMARAMKQAA